MYFCSFIFAVDFLACLRIAFLTWNLMFFHQSNIFYYVICKFIHPDWICLEWFVKFLPLNSVKIFSYVVYIEKLKDIIFFNEIRMLNILIYKFNVTIWFGDETNPCIFDERIKKIKWIIQILKSIWER